jgi:long-chain acyl-CoA synthetase
MRNRGLSPEFKHSEAGMTIPDYVKNRFWLKSYPADLPADYPVPSISLSAFVEEGMKRNKDRVAMIYGGREVTYTALLDMIDRCASAFHALGVKKGETVAIFLHNCPQFAVAYYGALKCGARVTALSPLFMGPEVEFQLQDSETQTLVVEDEFWPRVEGVRARLNVKRFVVVNVENKNPALQKIPGMYFFDDLLTEPRSPIPQVPIDPQEDLVALQYTGGTTGLPKAAMLTHHNVVANVLQHRAYLEVMEKREGFRNPVVVGVLPWYHIYGQTVDLSLTLYGGGTLVVFPAFDAEQVLRTIQERKAHIFMGVATMFVSFLNRPDLKNFNLKSLRWCNNGASIIPMEVVKRFEEITGVPTVEGYGLSEASPTTHTTSPLLERKIGSVGPPVPNTLQAIMDPETGAFVPLGEAGELIVHGPQVMKGYWKRPQETEQVFLSIDGKKWLRTGDMGVLDEGGYLTIVDRAKELIKYKGHSVYPREIEEVLFQHPAVNQAAVIGVLDPVAGENIKAFVVLNGGYEGQITEAEIIAWTRERLAAYKYPRSIEFIKELPKSPVGKILKRVLRDRERKKAAGQG